jgi:amidase
MVPASQGSDGMGSIRIPSACCGLVGIKPGLGVVPSEIGNGSWFDMTENGPMATTVADCALVLSVLADLPDLAEPPAVDGLRLVVSTKAPLPLTPVDRAFAAAANQVAELLAGNGHRLARATPPYGLTVAVAGIPRWMAGTELDARLLVDRSLVSRRTATHAAGGRMLLRANAVRPSSRAGWQRKAERFFADHDVLITPGLAQLPLPAFGWHERSWIANIWSNAQYAPFAAPWNLAGWPAMTVPAGLHPSGMPAAVQLVGRPGSEATLLGLAAQIERLQPWPRLAPAYR